VFLQSLADETANIADDLDLLPLASPTNSLSSPVLEILNFILLPLLLLPALILNITKILLLAFDGVIEAL
jgi:hypothetical protein